MQDKPNVKSVIVSGQDFMKHLAHETTLQFGTGLPEYLLSNVCIFAVGSVL